MGKHVAGFQSFFCKFLVLFEKLRTLAETQAASKVIEAIVDEVKYRDWLRESYPDGDSRIENVDELITAAETYMETAEDKTLPAFLEEIALVADVDTLDETRPSPTAANRPTAHFSFLLGFR